MERLLAVLDRDDVVHTLDRIKTAAELETAIKLEDDICEWPTDIAISVQPNRDSWKIVIMQHNLKMTGIASK